MTEEHLTNLKLHLRIDYDDDNQLLETYFLSAIADVETLTRRPFYGTESDAICLDENSIPDQVWQFILLRVGDYYQQRELSAEKPYNTYYKHILDRYINYADTDKI